MKSRKGRWQPPDADMREVIMGFPRGYTLGCWSTKEKRENLMGYELARCSLVGNTFNVPVMAWLVSQQLFKWKANARLPSIDELADPWCPCDLSGKETSSVKMSDGEALLALARHYFSKQGLWGGYVRAMSEMNIAKATLPSSIDLEEWPRMQLSAQMEQDWCAHPCLGLSSRLLALQ